MSLLRHKINLIKDKSTDDLMKVMTGVYLTFRYRWRNSNSLEADIALKTDAMHRASMVDGVESKRCLQRLGILFSTSLFLSVRSNECLETSD